MEIIQSPTVPRLQQNLWLDSTNNTLNAPTKDGWKSITSGASGGGITETTYEELVGLRDAGELVPGTLYRITDYITTTSQTNTESAEHQFDIIVLALSENSLSEDAKAALHEGDTYFSECNLDAWKIKYCIDNDTTRFAWADDTNGRGVIYWMQDERNNECPYDFKNICLKQAADSYVNISANTFYYTFCFTSGGIKDASVLNDKPCFCNKIGEYVADSGKRKIPNNIIHSNSISTTEPLAYNVFGTNCDSNVVYRSRHNFFSDRCTSNKLSLSCNYNVFLYSTNNKLYNGDCHDNYFLRSTNNSLDGGNVYNNYFMDSNSNISKKSFQYNLLVKSSMVKFGEYCSFNTILMSTTVVLGDNCSHNKVGPNCSDIIYGNKSYPSANLEYTVIEPGNKNITLNRSTTGVYKYIKISSGVNTTTSTKNITLGATDTNYLTTYKTANDVEIDV